MGILEIATTMTLIAFGIQEDGNMKELWKAKYETTAERCMEMTYHLSGDTFSYDDGKVNNILIVRCKIINNDND